MKDTNESVVATGQLANLNLHHSLPTLYAMTKPATLENNIFFVLKNR